MPIIGVEEKWPNFNAVAVKPDAVDAFDAFEYIDQDSFPGQWKVYVFYPKDFTHICPTELIGFDNLRSEFASRGAEILVGNGDNEYCKVAWKASHEGLAKTKLWMFSDPGRGDTPLSHQVGAFNFNEGCARRATFIVDPAGWVQWASVYSDNVGRNPDEVLRVLDSLQTGEMCACNRQIGEETL